MHDGLKGKIAIVTGHKGKLGQVWCEILERYGVYVYGFDLPENDIQLNLDINRFRMLVMYEQKKPPDIIINNAAIDRPPTSGGMGFFEYEKEIAVNLQGTLNVCSHFIPWMVEAGGGTIINIGSIMGNIAADFRNYPEGFSKPVGYNVTKAALIQLSRSICVEYGRYNIRAVTLSYGPVDTGKLSPEFLEKFLKNVPLNRPVSIESLEASLIFALTCPELSGQQICVEGGYLSW